MQATDPEQPHALASGHESAQEPRGEVGRGVITAKRSPVVSALFGVPLASSRRGARRAG